MGGAIYVVQLWKTAKFSIADGMSLILNHRRNDVIETAMWIQCCYGADLFAALIFIIK